MTADEQANLVLAFAKVLYVNGQAPEQTVSVALAALALCGAIGDPSAMLRAYVTRANGPEHLGNQSEGRFLK